MTIKGYISNARTAVEFQKAIDMFNSAGVTHDNIIINANFGDVINGLEENSTLLILSYTEVFGSLTELFATIIELSAHGITIKSLSEPKVAFTSMEIDFIKILNDLDAKLRTTRTKQGLNKARENGVKLGRPFGSTKVMDKVQEVIRLHKKTDMTISKACRLVGCQPRTYYRYLEKVSLE